jgi:hypothetical protein
MHKPHGGLMNRMLSLTFIFAVIITSSACSGKKPPEQATVKSKNVLSVLRGMSKAYEQKNLDAFMSDISANFSDRAALANTLTAVFAKYETVHFNIQYAKMLIMIGDKGPIRTTFTWDAEWLSASSGALKDGGRVTLVFEPGSYKLVSIEGKNPFLAQPGQTPGNK